MLDESTASTGSRTSSHVAMGDTRSIVLALQTLQEKIRKLESDRNFHQDQCERERANHEEYKRDTEVQLDRERKEHRRRESELQDLITRATAERNTLQGTLEESRRDIGAFRSELETLLERERKDATKRDEKLQAELTQLHAELAKERRHAEAAAENVKSLKLEKETIETTNKRLEETVQEMVAMNNTLIASSSQRNQKTRVSTSTAHHHVDAYQNIGVGSARGRPASAHAPQNRSSASAHNTSTGALLGHFAQATHSSDLKCQRHEGHENSFESKQVLRRPSPTVRSATPPRSGFMGPPRQSTAVATITQHNTSAAHHQSHRVQDERIEALDELYTELQAEHEALNRKYNLVVRRASDPDQESGKILSPGQLTAELNSIMSKIDKKTEQMQMVRQSRNKLEKEGRTAGTTQRGPRNPKGFEKATRKTALMNELRGLFNRSLQQ